MIDKNKVMSLVEEALADSQSYIVDVIINAGNFGGVEIENEEGVDIDESIQVSRNNETGIGR